MQTFERVVEVEGELSSNLGRSGLFFEAYRIERG